MNIGNFRTQYGMALHTLPTNVSLLHFRFLGEVLVLLLCLPARFLEWTCVCFANNKTFPTFSKVLF